MKAENFKERQVGWLLVDLRGQDLEYASTKTPQWWCRCVCGRRLLMSAARLRRGGNLSCGCKNWTGKHSNAKYEPKMASSLGLFNRMRNAARKRIIPWALPFEAFAKIVSLPCFWCKSEPFEKFNSAVSKNGYTQRKHVTPYIRDGWIVYNGLDRRDNDSGYEETNVLPSCKYCNFARNDRTVEEFQSWLKRIADAYRSD